MSPEGMRGGSVYSRPHVLSVGARIQINGLHVDHPRIAHEYGVHARGRTGGPRGQDATTALQQRDTIRTRQRACIN